MTETRLITKGTLGSIFGFFVFALFLWMPRSAFAASYGEGTYGEGIYNRGAVPTISQGQQSFSSAPGCTSQKPLSAPDLFQINAKHESLVLYFSPAMGPQDRYAILYGTKPDEELWGYEFLSQSTGVISVEIGELQRNTRYFFKVRAGNGCMPGDWSNTLSASTGQLHPSYRWTELPNYSSAAWSGPIQPVPTPQKEAAATATPSPTSKNTATPRPSDLRPTAEPFVPSDIEAEAERPSFWQRVVNFFKGIFRR